MVQNERIAAQFFDDAESNGLALESLIETYINGARVSKHLESGTEINYDITGCWSSGMSESSCSSPPIRSNVQP